MIKAEIIADSLNTHGQRITTFLLDFPRIVLAEFNTHRMFSRNSASSRAIPFEKMLERCENEPFKPIDWMKDHPGMQGNEFFHKDSEEAYQIEREWFRARDFAIKQAKVLSEKGLSKQFCNRLLEPYMWHRAIVTATEWENFFSLRAEAGAEIHIQALAYKMLEVYNASTPKQLKAGEWHIPFGDRIDEARILNLLGNKPEYTTPLKGILNSLEDIKIKIATARCARVSYMNFEGKDDYEADVKLHDRLVVSGHWSPFEHCARAMSEFEFHDGYVITQPQKNHRNFFREDIPGYCGNFRGFIQYRKTFEGENRSDARVVKRDGTTRSNSQQSV